jgi:prepilin-type N-terminal cleavage/methylation domain-containing protein
MKQGQHGFTLIEMAVAVFIIALLLGSILVPLVTQVEQRQISDTQKAMEEIKEALVGFAIANGYLPCPDLTAGANSNDGQEDVAAGTCSTVEGNVPWVTLGTVGVDPWGNRFRYQVDLDFARRAPFLGPPLPPFSLASSADLRVCTLSTCVGGTLLTSAGPNGAAAVILSHGKNGLGAINSNTNAANTAPTSLDEQANTDGNTTFVYRPPTPVGSAAGEFDDIVSWVSKFTLFNRMVAAGKLP